MSSHVRPSYQLATKALNLLHASVWNIFFSPLCVGSQPCLCFVHRVPTTFTHCKNAGYCCIGYVVVPIARTGFLLKADAELALSNKAKSGCSLFSSEPPMQRFIVYSGRSQETRLAPAAKLIFHDSILRNPLSQFSKRLTTLLQFN